MSFNSTSFILTKSSIFVFCLFSILTFSNLSLNLSINLLNFKVLNTSKTASFCHCVSFKSWTFFSIGTSVFIVPKVLDNIAKSLFSNNFSFNLPLIAFGLSSNVLYILSIFLYSLINSSAVFSPTPGTPGILSEVSPISPFTSISWIGFTPYFSIISSSPNVSVSVFPILVWGILIAIFLLASWNVSLSPETIVTSKPSLSPLFASVPKISSASYPSFSIIVIFILVKISLIIGICSASSFGIPFLVALYPSYILCLAVGAFRSNATAIYSGFTSSITLNNIAKKP